MMEAQCGNIGAARAVFQEGVWASPRGKGISGLWQAWAMVEAKDGQSKDGQAKDGFGEGSDTERLTRARKYFQ